MFVIEIDINKDRIHPNFFDSARRRLENNIGVYVYTEQDIFNSNVVNAKSCSISSMGSDSIIYFNKNLSSYVYKVNNLFEINPKSIAIKKLMGLSVAANTFINKYGYYWYELFYNHDRNERFLISVDEDIENIKNPFAFKTLLCIDRENEEDYEIRHDPSIHVYLNAY